MPNRGKKRTATEASSVESVSPITPRKRAIKRRKRVTVLEEPQEARYVYKPESLKGICQDILSSTKKTFELSDEQILIVDKINTKIDGIGVFTEPGEENPCCCCFSIMLS